MTPRISSAQQEIHQNRPFRSKGHELVIALLLTGEAIKRRGTLLFDPHGVTGQQYNVLRILRGAGDAGMATLDIPDRMIERAPGITRLLDRLEKKGWVRRQRCASDRRQVLCYITAEGLKLLGRLDRPVATLDDAMVRGLTVAEQARLVELVDKVRAAAR